MSSKDELVLDTITLKKAAQVFRALNHDLRQQMLQLINLHSKMPVTDIYQKLGLEQSVASQQLAILRKERFVITEKSGKQVFYSVNHTRIQEVQQISKSFPLSIDS